MKKIEHEFKELDIEDAYIDNDGSIIFYVINDEPTTIDIPLSDLQAMSEAMGYNMVKKEG